MYSFVHSAFSALKSYYSTHSPQFLKGLSHGRLIQILRDGEMLMYSFVYSAFSALKSYYSTHSPQFLKSLSHGRLVQFWRGEVYGRSYLKIIAAQ